jgi:serine/threonine protein phosphatase PrpC
VFDGHGGGEVAQFAKTHFTDILKNLKSYQEKNYGDALRQGFLQVDVEIESPSG